MLEKPRHEIFCQHVARGKSQAEAYVIAGYKKSDANAAILAARPEIIGRIEEIKGLAAMRAQVSVDRVVAELARIAFSNVTDALQVKNGKVYLIDSDKLTPDLKAAISEIRQTRDGVVIKFHDKRAALENLGKHLGLFKENTALNVNISLADLVNGSYRVERGELAVPAIEAKALPAANAESEHLPLQRESSPGDVEPKG